MCPMDLYIYPFDIQTCRFNLTLRGKINSKDVQWSLSQDELLEYIGSPLQLFQFIYFKKKSNQDDQQTMMFELRIARRYGSDILVTFLPCFVMELIGLSVFAIPLENLSDRLTVSISCLIVMAALLTQISSTLPVSADPKMIDSWMFIHVLIMAVAFFCMVLLEIVNRKLGPDKEEGDRWLKKVKIHPYKDEDEETDEAEDFTFPTKLNKYLAILSLLSYFTFVVVFIGYIFGVRNSVLGAY
ncbi:glycine receptor subunit alpha-3-like [Hyalella azteca]|uniref:Glycine receptor subunit alpha-3-like n=1 Tax=Hyalella azteca TaxID=294128 RepID=A0A979FRQ1_HYAAZ|nr:glycine receptor subunit alpha-3-like [Hyalella azteca]